MSSGKALNDAKNSMNPGRYIIGFIVYALLVANSFAETYTKIPEKQEFIEETLATLNGTDPEDQWRAARSLGDKGITEPAIYQRIEELVRTYSKNPDDEEKYGSLGWLMIGLAYSGDEKYRPLIEELAENGKGRADRHARKALKLLYKYKSKTPQLAREDLYAGEQSWKSLLLVNTILYTDDYPAQEDIAVRMIKRQGADPYALEAMNQKILSDYQIRSKNGHKIQAYAYMLQAMLMFPTLEFVETTSQVAEGAGDRKLARYAKKYLKKNKHILDKLNEFDDLNIKGQKFREVEVIINTENDLREFEKEQVQSMNLENKIIHMLKINQLFDRTSPNIMKVEITAYRFGGFDKHQLITLLSSGTYVAAEVTLDFVESNTSSKFQVDAFQKRNQYVSPAGPLSGKLTTAIYNVFKYSNSSN